MTFRRGRAGLAALAAAPLLVLGLVRAPLAGADSVTLTSPVTAACVTSSAAVYRVENGALHPVRGEFWIFPQGSTALRPRADLPSEGQPGGLLKAYVRSAEPLDSVSLELGTPEASAQSRAVGFAETSSAGVWAVLLGLSTWQGPGTLSLTLRASAGSRSYLKVVPFTVRKRSFFSETLPLDADLTQLVSSPDEQKAQETRVLVAVLTTPHPDAVFETGTLLTPFRGARRTSGYGDRRDLAYSDGTHARTVHLGVDIAAATGTPVESSGRGRVVFAAPRILTGNTIIIEHLPGLFSVYYHLSAIGVSAGDLVEKGQVIGRVGMTGFATGPHLHWEIQALGVAVDPDQAAASPLLDTREDLEDIGRAFGIEGR